MVLPPFQHVLDTYRLDVYRFLLASVGPHDADDCFQETFLSALRAYPRLAHGSNLRSWILTIAHRKVIDAHRAKARRPVPGPDPVGDRSRPGEEMDGTVPFDDPVWAALRVLPLKQRGAVLHRVVNDLSYAEIGRILGTSEDAARRSAHEGLKKLRAAMGARRS